MKLELVYDKSWSGLAEVKGALFEYIEIFYNRERLHSSLDYSTPSDYREAHKSGQAA